MPEWVFQLLAVFGACATVYAGVKYDLARAIAKAEAAEGCAVEAKGMAAKAHERIDGLLIRGQ